MERILLIVSKRRYKWPFLAIFSVTTTIYCLLNAIGDSKVMAVISILTAFIDWLGIFGFIKRKAFIDFKFWRGWFIWSILWFFLLGTGRELFDQFAFDLWTLGVVIVYSLFYGTFFFMLYVYAYVDEEIWR
jgi:hypothetical protein